MVAIPLKDLTAVTVAYELYSKLFYVYGYADIHSDNAPCFRSGVMNELAMLTGIEHTFSLVYHSQGNARAERTIQIIQRGLQCYIDSNQKNWSYYLPFVTFAHNTSACRSIGLADTPFYLIFGRDASIGNVMPYDPDKYKENIVLNIRDAVTRAYQTQEHMHKSYKQYYDRSRNEVPFRIGDRCYLFRPKIGKNMSRALTTQYVGPLRILDSTDTAALVQPCLTPRARETWVALKRLKLVRVISRSQQNVN